MAIVAKYFGGAYPIIQLYSQVFAEIWFWYKKLEFQQLLEESEYELSFDEKGNRKKQKPSSVKIRKKAEEKAGQLRDSRNGK